MKKLLIILSLVLLAGCVGKRERHGMCSHPAILGGTPFELSDNAQEVEGRIISDKDDVTTILTGAQCFLQYTPVQKK